MFDALATLFLVLVVQAYGIMSTDDYLRLPRVEASGRFFYGVRIILCVILVIDCLHLPQRHI